MVLTALRTFKMKYKLLLLSCVLAFGANASEEAENPELRCLAKNMYHEARGESFEGQVAVALVTLNRVKSKHYPNSICEVVYQHKQFSWTLNEPKITGWRLYHELRMLAYSIMTETVISRVGNSKHYHANTVEPYWAKTMKVAVVIDNHIFYK